MSYLPSFYFPGLPSRAFSPTLVEAKFVWTARWQRVAVPSPLEVDRGERTAGSAAVPAAIAPWRGPAKPTELVGGWTSAARHPAGNKKRESGSCYRSSDTSHPIPASPPL